MKSGRCCKELRQDAIAGKIVSIPLKSGRCCKAAEILQMSWEHSLNPFEVREVLQVKRWHTRRFFCVSIPLKSGRCCKRKNVSNRKRRPVSIPLKSGRCCKSIGLGKAKRFSLNPFEVREVLQDANLNKELWRQVSIPLKSGRCCKQLTSVH